MLAMVISLMNIQFSCCGYSLVFLSVGLLDKNYSAF